MITPVPKQTANRSEDYMVFVNAQPCASCRKPGPSDAHHLSGITGTGIETKTSDYLTIPLCRICHNLTHLGHPTDRVEALETALRLLDRYLTGKEVKTA